MQMISEIFSDIVKKYGLKEKTIRENVKAFVSSNYVLIIVIGHFSLFFGRFKKATKIYG